MKGENGNVSSLEIYNAVCSFNIDTHETCKIHTWMDGMEL